MISGPWPLYFAFISALPTVFTELWCMGPAPGCTATEASLVPLHRREPEVEGRERDKGFRRSRSQHETGTTYRAPGSLMGRPCARALEPEG